MSIVKKLDLRIVKATLKLEEKNEQNLKNELKKSKQEQSMLKRKIRRLSI